MGKRFHDRCSFTTRNGKAFSAGEILMGSNTWPTCLPTSRPLSPSIQSRTQGIRFQAGSATHATCFRCRKSNSPLVLDFRPYRLSKQAAKTSLQFQPRSIRQEFGYLLKFEMNEPNPALQRYKLVHGMNTMSCHPVLHLVRSRETLACHVVVHVLFVCPHLTSPHFTRPQAKKDSSKSEKDTP